MRNASVGLLMAMMLSGTAMGLSWTRATASAEWEPRQGHACVVFNNKMWVLGGFGGGGPLNDVWYSEDGASWTRATASAPWSARWLLSAVAFNGRMWVLGGLGAAYENDVWHSTDGVNWTQATPHAEWSGRMGHTSLVYQRPDDTTNGIWLLGGDDGSQGLHDVWRSANGVDWERVTAAAEWGARSQHSSCVFQYGGQSFMMVIGSWGRSGYSNECWFYACGSESWSQILPGSWSERRRHTSVSLQNKLWVLGGEDASGFRNDVWWYDGSSWTCANSSAEWSARDNHASVVLNSRMWVLGGYDGSGQTNDVWCSSQLSAVGDSSRVSPRVLRLNRVYPNPARTSSEVQYSLARAARVKIAVYGCSGNEIRTLATGLKAAGNYATRWTGVDNSGQNVAPVSITSAWKAVALSKGER